MKKFNSGITLIALIISIIVLLILAGVSINALVGENGIITQAMNVSFYNEMASVQESFELWKTKHYDDDEIPTNGLVKASDLENNGRLSGEIVYYRNWSENKTMPEESVKSDLNTIYAGEIVYIPRGVEDLFYLNNAEIGIKSDKKYIIDATNSMIYAINGYNAEGITVHSLAMYKAVVNGVNTAPSFAAAEVSGAGNNIVYAGQDYLINKEGKYVDENGNIVSENDKRQNPYGFKIIADTHNSNLYKLYNNGDLYVKGVKGCEANTAASEMSEMDSAYWNKLIIPAKILDDNTIQDLDITFNGDRIFVIDKNKDVWAWGDNGLNQLGLTADKKIEYSKYDAVKLDFGNKKVQKVWDTGPNVFYLVKDGSTYELYASGANDCGQLRNWKS